MADDFELLKNVVKDRLREDITKQIAEIILPAYPTAVKVYFNPGIEYNDEDTEYYNAMVDIYDDQDQDLVDLYELDYNTTEYDKAQSIIEAVNDAVVGSDFAFAFGGIEGHTLVLKK
jgi:hypothetical protein